MTEQSNSELRLQLEQIEEWQKAQRGELYLAFVPELIAVRDRCTAACERFNDLRDRTRRKTVAAWRDITLSPHPLPPVASTPTADEALFTNEPYILAPTHMDYGINVHIGAGAFLNFNSTFVDTCPIKIGARTLVGPNCSFFAGAHPLDPAVRNGLLGPETGKPISIGEDCWLGGNVIVLAGVTIGKGCTVGAGSVVTKDVPPFHVVAGAPARILRKIESSLDTGESVEETPGPQMKQK